LEPRAAGLLWTLILAGGAEIEAAGTEPLAMGTIHVDFVSPGRCRARRLGRVCATVLRVCARDPLITMVRELFDATPLRVPDDRFEPLSLLVGRRGRLRHYGRLSEAVRGFPDITPSVRALAEVSAVRSRSTDLQLGCEILAGLLTGIAGVPVPFASLSSGFRSAGVSSLTFRFPSPRRVFISPLELGRLVDGRRIDSTPVTQTFLDARSEIMLVDSVIIADRITVEADSSLEDSLHLGLDHVGQLSYAQERGGGLTISSVRALPFAFSCFRLALDDDGGIAGVVEVTGSEYRVSGFTSAEDPDWLLPYAVLTQADELLDVD
jgi:hypothetical protein